QLYSFNFDSNARITQNRPAIMDAFASNDNDPMTVADIQNIARVSPSVVRTMIKNGGLIPGAQREKNIDSCIFTYQDLGNIKLNEQQQNAADAIGKSIESGGFSVYLLDGITGSGKTQVYFDSAWRAYSQGKSVLLMMPEIALTAQFMSRFESRFGAPPVVWHSNLTAARRREIWRGVLNGKIKIIVGTRSALFLPWQDLGLVVIDEEHDTSYKQEDMGNYHARDMAILRAKISGFPVVLASATPSAETLENVNIGKYKSLRLTSRYGGAQLPEITTIDLRENRPTSYMIGNVEQTGYLSPLLCDALSETLAQGHQAMLFINRRGFAPIVQCKKCGWTATCQECSVGMTYHKRIGKLLCHMCGRTAPLSKVCPDCGCDVSMRGIGLEKIQEEVTARFPNVRTALVSSDVITSRQVLERLVKQLEDGEIDIVIGTQILAKGHHFPNLTLVGIVDSDMGLFGTDFRAAEHTFQQLFQVAGRAGRGKYAGRVLLQTYQPTHPVLTAICSGDRDGFMRTDMMGRKAAQMPPYGMLIAIIIEGQKEAVLQKYCQDLATAAPILHGAKIMGPITAQIYQIRNWYRMRFLVAGGTNMALQPVIERWISKVKQPVNIRVKIDVNPINFM
ncbi:MAG: primosomal protein N', partial [Alphaproteobacteria bacterium]